MTITAALLVVWAVAAVTLTRSRLPITAPAARQRSVDLDLGTE